MLFRALAQNSRGTPKIQSCGLMVATGGRRRRNNSLRQYAPTGIVHMQPSNIQYAPREYIFVKSLTRVFTYGYTAEIVLFEFVRQQVLCVCEAFASVSLMVLRWCSLDCRARARSLPNGRQPFFYMYISSRWRWRNRISNDLKMNKPRNINVGSTWKYIYEYGKRMLSFCGVDKNVFLASFFYC